MTQGKKLLIIFISIFIVAEMIYAIYNIRLQYGVQPTLLIAHAGGAIRNLTYTNSLEALDYNYGRGHRFFEADISFTSDNRLVLIHDWGEVYNNLFLVGSEWPTEDEFMSLTMKHGLHQMDMEGLYRWLNYHKDAYIITDAKSDNILTLTLISKEFPDYKDRLIPQIYQIEEYKPAKDLGYKNIIFLLDKTKISNEEIIDFTESNGLFAVTMNKERAKEGWLAQKLKEKKVFVYVYTINNIEEFGDLQQIGTSGFYTDFIAPSELND